MLYFRLFELTIAVPQSWLLFRVKQDSRSLEEQNLNVPVVRKSAGTI